MQISKIYLDMDGVLCNFERRYFELYNELPGSMRDRKEFNKNWDDFVLTKQFETLDVYPGALELIAFVNSTGIPVEILSSSGGAKYHDIVAAQKAVWLKSVNLKYKPNIVSGRKAKGDGYAAPDVILVDDTTDVIEHFNKCGGIGILHKEVGNTIKMIEYLINK